MARTHGGAFDEGVDAALKNIVSADLECRQLGLQKSLEDLTIIVRGRLQCRPPDDHWAGEAELGDGEGNKELRDD